MKGYARITWSSGSAVLDTGRSKNISNLYSVAGEENYFVCFTLSSTPRSLSVTGESSLVAVPSGAFKDGTGWTQSSIGSICDGNGSGANAGIELYNGSSPILVTLF